MAEQVRVEGLREFRNQLREIDVAFPKELRKVSKSIADKAAGWARSNAASGSRMQASAAGAITGRATQMQASIGLSRHPYANAAFWGAKKRTGWYAAAKYAGSAGRQFPEWVGNGWEVGGSGGPYAINPALAEHMDDLMHEYDVALDELAAIAFHQ